MRENYLVQGWLVVVLCLVFGGVLAGVEMTLHAKIDANKLAETLGQVPRLVPAASEGRADTVAGQTVYRALSGTRQVGWVIPCRGQGFADQIALLVGVDLPATTITGLYVLDQKETPGLGNKIQSEEWRRQFVGKSALTPLVATRTRATAAHEIDAITGATISSTAVCQIINQSLTQWRPELAARGAEEGRR